MLPGRSPGASGRRFPAAALWVSGGLLVAAVIWLAIAVPALVKYPTDLDVALRYEGTFRLLVNPATAAPLAEPIELPLVVERHVRGVPGESTSSQVLVRETIEQRAGELVHLTQENAYVMDRRTLQNVADPRAYAFQPANAVDRSGMYRLNLPFGTSSDAQLDIYKNEIGTGYRMSSDALAPEVELSGLALLNFRAAVTDAPVTPAYLAELNRMAPLPATMTVDQLKPHLRGIGVDVDALVAALGPQLSPEDAAALAAFVATPVPLEYVLSFEGRAAVEPVTGAEVQVGSTEALGVRPQAASVAALSGLLDRYPEVPDAATARATLDGLTSGSIPVFEYRFEQTPASVAEVAGLVSSQRRQLLLATIWVPAALVLLGLVVPAIGLVVFLRRRPEPLDLTAAPGQVALSVSEAPAAEPEELTSPRRET